MARLIQERERAVVTYEDIILARAAIHNGGNPLAVRDALLALDGGAPSLGGLLPLLLARRVFDREVAERARAQTERYLFLRRESAYIHFLRAVPNIDTARLGASRARQNADAFARSLGDYLVEDRVIDAATDIRLMKQAESALRKTNQELVAKSKSEGFFDIEGMPKQVQKTFEGAQDLQLSQLVEEDQSKDMLSRLDSFMDHDDDDEAAAPAPAAPISAAQPPIPAPPAPTTAFSASPALPGRGRLTESTRSFSADEIASALGHPLKGTGLDEKFKLIDKLGQGNMGVVYLAEEADSGRRCALKVMLAKEKNQDGIARFKREILATSFFSHPNVIEIYDGGPTSDGSFYMAMEYVEGEPLSKKIKRDGLLKIREVLPIFDQVLDAMVAAHGARIIHRDLKPENFMVRDAGAGKLQIKIMDFGIARILDEEQDFSNQFFQTMVGSITGSPAYVSPETVTEAQVDERADLYTMGIILFELAVGFLPFKGREVNEFLQHHLYTKPPDPEEAGAHRGVNKELSAFILKLMEKNRKDRFQKAEDALKEFREKVVPSFDRPKAPAQTMAMDRETLKAELAAIGASQATAKGSTPASPPEPQKSGWFGLLKKRILGK